MKIASLVEFGLSYVTPGHAVAQMSADEVRRRLGQPDFFVVDCNTRSRFEAAHLPGAVHVDFDAVTREVLPADLDATLLFYCASPI